MNRCKRSHSWTCMQRTVFISRHFILPHWQGRNSPEEKKKKKPSIYPQKKPPTHLTPVSFLASPHWAFVKRKSAPPNSLYHGYPRLPVIFTRVCYPSPTLSASSLNPSHNQSQYWGGGVGIYRLSIRLFRDRLMYRSKRENRKGGN